MKIKLLLITLLLISAAGYSQDITDWKLSGQIQLRGELDGRDFSNETYAPNFANLRTRFGVEKFVNEQVGFFVQIQDSRIFGEERNTLTAIDNIDLHQGYVILNDPFELPMKLQAGRFEVSYGTERFFGAVGWHYVGRSFDGLRMSFNIFNNIKFDVFALTLSDTTQYIGNALPRLYPYPAVPATTSNIYGFWKTVNLSKEHKADGFGYYEVNRTNNPQGNNALDLFTLGLNHSGSYGALSSLLEGAYQFGSAGESDISAYLVSLQLNYAAGISKFGIGADILSGTSPDDEEINTFRPTYGTNHKFYGFMDYFINIPENTLNLGLNDFYATAGINPQGSKFSGSLAVHHFMSNVEPGDADAESVFGQEVDLTIKYDFIKGTAITWGGSMFFPGDLMKLMYSTSRGEREDASFWTYLMITTNL